MINNINMEEYGLSMAVAEADEKFDIGRICAVHKDRYNIVCEKGFCNGILKKSIYYNDLHDSNEEFPTVGDFVLFEYNPSGDSRIVKTLQRKTFFSRKDPTPGRGEQAVAANFDYVFIMQSLNFDLNLKRLERYLTLSWQSGAVPVVVLTKADLIDDEEKLENLTKQIEKAAKNVCVYCISAKTGYNLKLLNAYLKKGKTIVLLGSSGVGKSSLVNVLANNDVMQVNSIREDDSKGRHTTTHRQLIMLKNGVMIIYTPGMRELGMWDVSYGLDESFKDVEEFLGQCKFSDCKHNTEPGCAIKEALYTGKLSFERWNSYNNLKNEATYSDNKPEYLRKKQQWHKEIAKYNKSTQKAKK